MNRVNMRYTCLSCGRSFGSPENLHRHRRTHDTVLPHPCPDCNKEFSRSDLLKKHQLTHQKTSSPEATNSSINLDESSYQERAAFRGSAGHTATQVSHPSRNHDTIPGSSREGLPPELVMGSDAMDVDTYGLPSIEDGHFLGGVQDPVSDFWLFTQFDNNGLSNENIWPNMDFSEGFWEQVQNNFGVHFDHSTCSIVESTLTTDANPYTTAGDHLYPTSLPATDDGEHAVGDPPALTDKTIELDYWPFATNPLASPRLQIPIIRLQDDSLIKDHVSRFEITEQTWRSVRYFLRGSEKGESAAFTLPPLKTVNIFIGLFFKFYSSQAPILHEPTISTNDLPPTLIAIIVIIGALYSNLQHTQGFAIVLLDRVRRNFQAGLDRDRSFMDDHLVLYAGALICYTSLWCGNRQAFDMVESLRGILVHRLRDLADIRARKTELESDIDKQWEAWINFESRSRILWFIFMIDSHFSVLLNTRSLLSSPDIVRWETPYDERLWSASTAQEWKSLFDDGTTVQSRTFIKAFLPFTEALYGHAPGQTMQSSMMPLKVNHWTSLLILTVLSMKAYEWSQDWLMARDTVVEIAMEDDNSFSMSSSAISTRLPQLVESRHKIFWSLDLWNKNNIASMQISDSCQDICYFRQTATILYHTTRMCLNVPLSILRKALALHDPPAMASAMSRLQIWCFEDDMSDQGLDMHTFGGGGQGPVCAAQEAIHLIHLSKTITDNQAQARQTLIPYSSIAVFLSYVVLWAFSLLASIEQKRRLIAWYMQEYSELATATDDIGILLSLWASNSSDSHNKETHTSFLRMGSNKLAKLGPWGVSLNLALLLYRRSSV